MALVDDALLQTALGSLLGALIVAFSFRHRPWARLTVTVFFFLILTLFTFRYAGVVPYAPETSEVSALRRLSASVIKIVWWVSVAWAATSLVRSFVTLEQKPLEGRLVQDVVIGLIRLGVALSVVTYVFSFPIGALLATSGIFAIIVGLALQNTLSDVFSGIAMNLSRPYSIGDWISVSDGPEGRVVETNWRSTHLINGSNDLVILPNSWLSKARLTNLSSPDRSHGASILVYVVLSISPKEILGAMHSAFVSSTTILSVPAPSVQIKSIDAYKAEFELSFFVSELSKVGAAKNELFDLIYRHGRAAGIRFADPDESEQKIRRDHAQQADSERPRSLRLVDALPLFAALTESEKATLAQTMQRRVYAKGDLIVRQDEVLRSLMIIRNGTVRISRNREDQNLIMKLAPGDCFGERGLLAGLPEEGTLSALTVVEAFEISKETLTTVMKDRPTIAEDLAAILYEREQKEHHLFSEQRANREQTSSVPSVLARIRRLFNLTL